MTSRMSNPFPVRFGPLLSPDGDTPAGGAPPAEPKAAEPDKSGDLTAKVKELESKLQAEQASKTKLEEFRKNAVAVLREDTPTDQRVQAYRQILADQGVVGDQADRLVAAVFEQKAAPGAEPGKTPEATPPSNKELESMRKDLARTRLRVVKEEMDRSLTGVMESKEIKEFSAVLNKLHTSEEAGKILTNLREQVYQTTLHRLGTRKEQAGGEFDEDWIREEANKAATEVVSPLRAVIGDASKIGRSPETVTGIEALVKKPPVPPPTYKRGMGMAQVDTAFTQFGEDRLLRAAAGMDGDGSTRA